MYSWVTSRSLLQREHVIPSLLLYNTYHGSMLYHHSYVSNTYNGSMLYHHSYVSNAYNGNMSYHHCYVSNTLNGNIIYYCFLQIYYIQEKLSILYFQIDLPRSAGVLRSIGDYTTYSSFFLMNCSLRYNFCVLELFRCDLQFLIWPNSLSY